MLDFLYNWVSWFVSYPLIQFQYFYKTTPRGVSQANIECSASPQSLFSIFWFLNLLQTYKYQNYISKHCLPTEAPTQLATVYNFNKTVFKLEFFIDFDSYYYPAEFTFLYVLYIFFFFFLLIFLIFGILKLSPFFFFSIQDLRSAEFISKSRHEFK